MLNGSLVVDMKKLRQIKRKNKDEKGENKGWRKLERTGRGNFNLELRL